MSAADVAQPEPRRSRRARAAPPAAGSSTGRRSAPRPSGDGLGSGARDREPASSDDGAAAESVVGRATDAGPGSSLPRKRSAELGEASGATLSGEPARGEEDNLNGYEWRHKRRRHDDGGLSKAGLAQSPDVAVAAAPLSALPLPYPIGLTPFRYPCCTPHLPPPPPGDPLDPALKRFVPPLPAGRPALAPVIGQADQTDASVGGLVLDSGAAVQAAAAGPEQGATLDPALGSALDPALDAALDPALGLGDMAALPLIDALYSLGQAYGGAAGPGAAEASALPLPLAADAQQAPGLGQSPFD